MAKQQYFCPICRHAGAIEHEEHADVFTVMRFIEGDHHYSSPNCDQPIQGIRVRTEGMCSDAEWAQLTGGKVG